MIRTIEALIEQRNGLQKQLTAVLSDLADESGLPFWRRYGQKKRLRSALLHLGQTIAELITVSDREWDAQSNNHSSQVFASLQHKIGTLDAEYRHMKSLLVTFSELEQRLACLIDHLPPREESSACKEELQAIKEQLSPFQYADFEQRFRGGREAVREQLKGYISLFSGHAPVLDLGCGRGEFVAMLLEAGIHAEGVDLSHSMLKEAKHNGLPCRYGELLSTLRLYQSGSLGGIFSAQVIEHIDTEPLRQLVNESFRALKPGGVLLLETINPLSLFAYSRIFLLDTTHQSALHPEFMRYLLESCAFNDIEILYGPLPEAERLALVPPQSSESAIHNQNTDKLNRLLFGSSIYAIKGIKP